MARSDTVSILFRLIPFLWLGAIDMPIARAGCLNQVMAQCQAIADEHNANPQRCSNISCAVRSPQSQCHMESGTMIGDVKVIMIGTNICDPVGLVMENFFGNCHCQLSHVCSTNPIPAPVPHHERPLCESGSIIRMDDKTVGERIAIVGTPFELVYFSNRVPGRIADFELTFPLTGPLIGPLNSQTVRVREGAGGTVLYSRTESGPSVVPNMSDTFTLPNGVGSDVGLTAVTLEYSPVFSLSQAEIDQWNAEFDLQVPMSPTESVRYPYTLGNYRPKKWGMGGWSLSIHHFYDPASERLFLGDGTSRAAPSGDLQFDGDPVTYRAVASEESIGQTYVFDASGRHLRTLSTKTGRTLYSFAYDSASRLSTITDAYSNVTTLQRDSGGALTAIVSPYGQTTATTLDSNGYLASVTNPNFETHLMGYTAGGLLLTFHRPAGPTTTMTYDAKGRLVSDTSSAGKSTTISTVGMGEISGIDGLAEIFTSTDSLNRQTTYGSKFANDIYWNAAVYPDGSKRARRYQPPALDIELSTAGSAEIQRSSGRMQDPWLGPMARIQQTRFITDSGVYWVMNNRTKNVTPGAAVAHAVTTPPIFQYTTAAITSTINNNDWIESYASANGKTTYTSPKNRKTYLTTDAYDKPTEFQWSAFAPVSLTYDGSGRLSGITQSARTSTLAYHPSGPAKGFLSSFTNAANQTTSFEYDDAGRVVTQTLPDAREIEFDYDANGNLTSVTPPGRSAHGFIRNLFDQIATYLPPFFGGSVSTPTTYAYNTEQQLTDIDRPDGVAIDITYNAGTGNLSGITTPGGSYAYTSQGGFVSQAISPDAFQLDRTTYGLLPYQETLVNQGTAATVGSLTYTYGNDFNLMSLVVTPGSGSPSTVGYLYDTDILLTKAGNQTITRSSTTGLVTGTTLSRIADTRTYDATYAEPATYSAQYNPASGSPTVLFSQTFTRDVLGRISAKSETVNGVTATYAYTYDSAGRLVDVDRNGSAQSDSTYDSNSNRTSGSVGGVPFTATYDAQDRIETYGTETFTHNLNGELTSRTDSATSMTIAYAYDAFGNLKQATLPAKTIHYKLDGFNRRVARLTGATVNAYYVYEDQLKVAAVLNASRQITHRFIYGTRSNVPDYMVRSGTTYRILSDERGSVRLVVNASTGAIAQQIEYDEFGKVLSDSSPGFQPFGFAGCLYDVDTKLCHFGAREYDASTGRWLTKDPILFAGRDTNLYGYVLNDPINFIDPNGLELTPAEAAAIGGGIVVGGIVGGGIPYAVGGILTSLGATGIGGVITGLTIPGAMLGGAIGGGAAAIGTASGAVPGVPGTGNSTPRGGNGIPGVPGTGGSNGCSLN